MQKKQEAQKKAKDMQRMASLEGLSRRRYVDPKYNRSDKIHPMVPVGVCGHCKACHYGYPYQAEKIVSSDGTLTCVPCPVQKIFEQKHGVPILVQK